VASNDKDLVEIDMLGTKLDAARLFDLGFAGGLTIDRDTRAALEALSTALPDGASEVDMQKLESTLRKGLPPEDADKAIKLFQDYRGYQADMKLELPALGNPGSQEASDAYFDRILQVQRKHFDEATAKALFGQDIQNARLGSLASLINRDSGLSPAQRKEQLDALRALLPADQRSLIPDVETAAPLIIDTDPVKR
jgi:lipase chaperone LimK